MAAENAPLGDGCALILAPAHRDAATLAGVLGDAGINTTICYDIVEICSGLHEHAAIALIAEEFLGTTTAADTLHRCLDSQPAWSEPPVLIVARESRGTASRLAHRLADYANVMLLERPLRSATLLSTVRSALRARRRQFQVRDHLLERQRTEARLLEQEAELRRLAENLESRVQQRTAELQEANRRLLTEMEQRQQAERALRQAQKMEAIGQLTGGVAHDFNNLLMVVQGGVNILERNPDTGRRERVLQGMRQAAARGESLTQQLLAFSRHIELKSEPIDLGGLLDGMRILVGGALRGDISVEINVASDLWPILADSTQLELAILNIVVNARDAMQDGGKLTITASNVGVASEDTPSGSFVRLEIRDTGVGIAPENLYRVFDPFFTTKAIGKGTGLGLSQVYGFAEQSGGRVYVRSNFGEGTSIILELPRALHHQEHRAEATVAPRQVEGGGRKVLLVEDNDDVATLESDMLDVLGFALTRVSNAQDAVAQLSDGKHFDLVFSDIVMPGGMSGTDLAHAIKDRHPDLPILLTTGYSEILGGAGNIGGVRVLRKPYNLDSLERTLKVLLGELAPIQS